MRKLKLIFAALCVVSALGFKANAQETPENKGIYYIYNEEADLFLTRGNNWGTRAIARPVGMPWVIEVLGNGNYKLRMYDITNGAIEGSGYGNNDFTDNDTPIEFTPNGNASEGFTLQNSSNYLTCPATIGDVNRTSTASKWKFLTQSEYNELLENRAAQQEAAIAAAKGIVIPKGQTLNDVVSNTNEWAASATVNDGTPNKDSWPVAGVPSRGGNQNAGNYGEEIYQGGGWFSKTISGLKPGIYKVSVRAQKRVKGNGDCYNMGQAGYPVSDAYFDANGYIIPIKAWSEDCVSDGNPNSTGEFVNIVNNGGYTKEGFVYVGNDGNLVMQARSEAYWNYSWFLFNGISYTFYDNEVSEEDAAAIIETANGIMSSQMGSSVKSALSSALSTFESNKTIANYNALNTAIGNANASINSYAALQTAITNANYYTIYKPVFVTSADIYSSAISTAQGVYEAQSVADCSDAITALTNSIHSAYESDYSVFADDYPYDYSTLLNPDMTKWASTDYVTMTANEHWNGLTGQRYYEQSGAEWGQTAWSHAASETVTLPAGNYIMSITARASEAVTSTMSVQVGDAAANIVSLTHKGASGRGITTAGVGSYADGTYAKSGEGFGWEYRYIAFTVAEESDVTISFNSSANEQHSWVSLASPLLKGDIHPKQIKLNQVKSLAATLTAYEDQISKETYDSFETDLAAASAATVESTNLDDIIIDLQNDITTAQTEKEAFERGAAMNALIAGDGSVVLSDEATAANWSPTPTFNDWSTEADVSGMVKPFLQNWVAKENSPLPDNSLTYVPIRGLQNGYYEVSALVRIYAENGETPDASSATFTVNGTSVNLLEGTQFDYNNMNGIYMTASVKMQIKDALNIGLAYSDATFNWIAWKNLTVTYLCAEPATTEDYTALNNAIALAEDKTLGFEKNEYAPYYNVAALEALAEAKAIDQDAVNAKETVVAATTALTGATWTPNDGGVDAIFNGSFSSDVEGDWGLTGWTRTNGWGQQRNDLPANSGASTNYGYYNQPGSLQYGNAGVYTMPLKANTIYNLTFKYASWEAGSNNGMTVSVLNASDGMEAMSFEANGTKYDVEGAFAIKTLVFVTGEAGNYVLTLGNSGNTVMTDVSITKAASQVLEFADGSVPTYAPGTYPQVKITRDLTKDRWATAIYPFAVSGVDEIAVFDSFNDVTGEVGFSTASGTSVANKPFLMRSTSVDKTEIVLNNVEVAAAAAEDVVKGDLSLKGVYAKTTVDAGENVKNYVLKDNAIRKVVGDGEKAATLNPYRAYFQLAEAASARELTFSVDGQTTNIKGLNAVNNAGFGKLYNLNGQEVKNVRKGIFIQNGKKVVK